MSVLVVPVSESFRVEGGEDHEDGGRVVNRVTSDPNVTDTTTGTPRLWRVIRTVSSRVTETVPRQVTNFHSGDSISGYPRGETDVKVSGEGVVKDRPSRRTTREQDSRPGIRPTVPVRLNVEVLVTVLRGGVGRVRPHRQTPYQTEGEGGGGVDEDLWADTKPGRKLDWRN